MREIDGEPSTPPEIIRVWEILAPEGTSLEQKIVAMNIAGEFYSAQQEKVCSGESNSEIESQSDMERDRGIRACSSS